MGNARTALAAWLSARAGGGSLVWRVEDLDPPRVVAGAADLAEDDLAWLGLSWDEGPSQGGPHAPYVQSARSEFYEAALLHLHDAERIFPCSLSRKELASIGSAPHGPDDEAPYPISARPSHLTANWYETFQTSDGAALRFRVTGQSERFLDRVQGETLQAPPSDFVLKRRDGLYAYQLAVVVDDWRMGITEVVRGADLLSSTARQLQLYDALGAPRPIHAHVPMVLGEHGEKLSKRDGAVTLQALRAAGVRPNQLVGYLAWSLGLLDRLECAAPAELLSDFAWERVGKQDHQLPADFAQQVLAVR